MNIGDTYQMIKARQILTSRGEPTVEVELHTSIGVFRSSCPSGASTGSREAKVILDGDKQVYNGKGVTKAIFHIKNIISHRIPDMSEVNINEQNKIDKFLIELDGTENKSRIGATSILPISQSFCRAGAVSVEKSLREFIGHLANSEMKMPIPYFNVINGGVHAGNKLPFQEVMIAFHYKEFDKNLERAAVFYDGLKKIIARKYGKISTSVGDEGGFAPPIETLDDALNLIMETYEEGKFENMKIAIDCAASEFYKDGKYDLYFKHDKGNEDGSDGGKIMTGDELVCYYEGLLNKYPLLHSLEDPFAENDFVNWEKLIQRVGNTIRIVGDDLTVTNPKFITEYKDLCNTLLVKLNQIGTVSESIEAVKIARKSGMKIMVSHRSGETEDTFIADFAVGIGADYIKAGAPCRGERVAKYNQLLRIYESIKKKKKNA